MKIGLVLGGSGARCLAQLGVLRALEQYDFEPVAVAASSTAALFGVLIAAGYKAEEILKIVRETDFLRFVSFRRQGALREQEGLRAFLKAHVPETFEGLALPFAVVAVDLGAGEVVVLHRGALHEAIAATTAFPGVFAPVPLGGRLLVDGGVLNPVPVDVIRSMTTEPVFAVAAGQNDSEAEAAAEAAAEDALVLIRQAYRITQRRLTQMFYVLHPPTVLIQPSLPAGFAAHDFGRWEEAVAAGFAGALEVLAERQLLPALLAGKTDTGDPAGEG